jgi:hypothetical protein
MHICEVQLRQVICLPAQAAKKNPRALRLRG